MEPNLINNNWIQTNAHILQEIKELLENNLTSSNSQCSGCTGCSACTTNITVQPSDVVFNQTIVLPRKFDYVSNPLPIVTTQNNVTYNVNYIEQEPIIIDIDRMNAYRRVCGSYNPQDGKYICCMRCVDRWINEHSSGFQISQLTSSGTGCKVERRSRGTDIHGRPL